MARLPQAVRPGVKILGREAPSSNSSPSVGLRRESCCTAPALGHVSHHAARVGRGRHDLPRRGDPCAGISRGRPLSFLQALRGRELALHHGARRTSAAVGPASWRSACEWRPTGSIRSTRARLGPMLLFLVGSGSDVLRLQREYGVLGGERDGVAALLTMPRVFAHAHFATLDGPVTACWLLAWALFARPVAIGAGLLASAWRWD